MEEKMPRYVKIAHDICGRILTGEFPEGTILKGRSMLASVYNVSPETIRKAVNILAEEKIIEVKHGVGIFVDSALRAQQYAEKWKSKNTVKENYLAVSALMEEAKNINQKIEKAVAEMLDNFKYQTNESIVFSEVEIPTDSWVNGKTIGEVYFWNYTEATIVAVVSKDDHTAQASPGPDFPLRGGDRLILVGKDDLSFERVLSFLTYGVVEE